MIVGADYLQVVHSKWQKKTCPHCGSAALRSENTDRRVVPTKGGQGSCAFCCPKNSADSTSKKQ